MPQDGFFKKCTQFFSIKSTFHTQAKSKEKSELFLTMCLFRRKTTGLSTCSLSFLFCGAFYATHFFVPYFRLQNIGVNPCWNVQSCAWDEKKQRHRNTSDASPSRCAHLDRGPLWFLTYQKADSLLAPLRLTMRLFLSFLELEKRKNSRKVLTGKRCCEMFLSARVVQTGSDWACLPSAVRYGFFVGWVWPTMSVFDGRGLARSHFCFWRPVGFISSHQTWPKNTFPTRWSGFEKSAKKFTDTLSDRCFNCKIGHDQPVREKQSQRSHRRPGTTRTPWHDPVCCLCSPGVEHQQMATARFGDVTGQESQSKKWKKAKAIKWRVQAETVKFYRNIFRFHGHYCLVSFHTSSQKS